MLPRHPKGVLVLGDLLRRRRDERRLSRTELADLSGVTTKTIQRAEADGPVSPAVVRLLCRVLGLELSELMRPSYAEVAQRLLACGRAPGAPPDEWVRRDAEVERVLDCLGCASVAPVSCDADASDTTKVSTAARRVESVRGVLCAITGPPGIGKTALAQHVVTRLAAHFPDGIAWLDGAHLDTPSRIATAQRDLAEALGFGAMLPGPDSASRDLFQAFRQHFASRRRLLVIDDVRRPECLEAFIPSSALGALMFTTHSRRVAERAGPCVIELGPVPSSVARAVLESFVGHERLEVSGGMSLVSLVASAPGTIHGTGRLLAREPFTQPADLVRRAEEGAFDNGIGSTSAHPGGWWEERLFRSFGELRPSLSPLAWHIWATLSVLCLRPFPTSLVASLCQTTPEAARSALSELFDHYLLRCCDSTASPHDEGFICFECHSASAARFALGPSAKSHVLERLVGLISTAAVPLPAWVADAPELAALCAERRAAPSQPSCP